MNKVILIGRLTKDPELRTTTGGLNVASFSIAVNRNFKNKEGNYDADFFNISIFGKQADNVSKYCVKGNLVAIEGRIQNRTYDAQDGSKRYVTDIVADHVEFLGSKKDSQNSGYVADRNYMDQMPEAPVDIQNNEIEVPEGDPYKDFGSEIAITDDDLPF